MMGYKCLYLQVFSGLYFILAITLYDYLRSNCTQLNEIKWKIRSFCIFYIC